jgi:hypothetical protein
MSTLSRPTQIEKVAFESSRKYARTSAVVGGPLVEDQVTDVLKGSRSLSNVVLTRSAALSQSRLRIACLRKLGLYPWIKTRSNGTPKKRWNETEGGGSSNAARVVAE